MTASKTTTRLALLGSGNPNPDPAHQGCAALILVDERPYVVDFGAGVVRQAAALTAEYGGPLAELDIRDLTIAFLTHLHSDHTLGYADLILTPWIMERDRPLEVYGPRGLKRLTEHLLEAYRDDIHYRVFGAEPANDRGWRVNAHEFDAEGVIYQDDLLKVEAFPVQHGTWPNAFGFRFTTPDKVIVFSGDTAPCENVVRYARGADILVHEVYSHRGYQSRPPIWQAYHAAHHTSTLQVAEIARRARPGLLVLTHTLFWGTSEQEILDEVASLYDGPVVVGRDLQIFT